MNSGFVSDEEVIHRSIPPSAVQWSADKWHLASEAFNDRAMTPSVDRRSIRLDAQKSLRGSDHGIAQLVTEEVRACDNVLQNPNAPVPEQAYYRLDVIADPIEEAEGVPPNAAHALIKTDPAVANKSRFKKVKESLCRLAELRAWVIEPMR